MLNDAEMNGRIQGVSICAGAPSITHLLFADDSLLLLKANDGNATHLRHVLQIYEICLGQKINKEKSFIVSSKNTQPQAKRRFMEILDLTQESMNERYLGLPVYMGRSKASVFGYLKESLEKNTGVEGKVAIKGRQRNFDQGSGTINSLICHAMFRSY